MPCVLACALIGSLWFFFSPSLSPSLLLPHPPSLCLVLSLALICIYVMLVARLSHALCWDGLAEVIQSCYRGFRVRMKLWMLRQREIKRARVASAYRVSSAILTSFVAKEAPDIAGQLVRAKQESSRTLDERLVAGQQGSGELLLPSPSMPPTAVERRRELRRTRTGSLRHVESLGEGTAALGGTRATMQPSPPFEGSVRALSPASRWRAVRAAVATVGLGSERHHV
jgi:hypothetical protein